MEKAWPPLKECYQFKDGLMYAALRKYPWEEKEYKFDFSSYYPPIPEELASFGKLLDSVNKTERPPSPSDEDCRDCPFCRLHPDPRGVDAPTGPAWYYESYPLDVDILNDPIWDMDPIPCPFHLLEHVWPSIGRGPPLSVTPTQLEDTKKYLNQVRNSRGYDVDCVPHLVEAEFFTSNLDKKDMKRTLDATAIVHINNKTGKVYELEDVLKVVWTPGFLNLTTFTAKVKDDDSAALETFIATTHLDKALIECLLRPGCNAPGPDHYPDVIIHPIEVPKISMKRLVALPYLCSCSRKRSHSNEVVAETYHRCRKSNEVAVEENRDEGGGSSSIHNITIGFQSHSFNWI